MDIQSIALRTIKHNMHQQIIICISYTISIENNFIKRFLLTVIKDLAHESYLEYQHDLRFEDRMMT